ncbi:MAG: hypothetical protein IJ371_06430 [Clostridia bacterium]|nr:hypothetical protein [Clostridia bacterium]
MKNYKVIATRYFKDSNEIDEKTGLKVERKVNDEFYCTKERYEFLKANNAVKLVEIQETIDDVVGEEVKEVLIEGVEEIPEGTEVVENVVIDAPVEVADTIVKEIVTKKKKSSKK